MEYRDYEDEKIARGMNGIYFKRYGDTLYVTKKALFGYKVVTDDGRCVKRGFNPKQLMWEIDNESFSF